MINGVLSREAPTATVSCSWLIATSLELFGAGQPRHTSVQVFTRQCHPRPKTLTECFAIRRLEATFARVRIEVVVAVSLSAYPGLPFIIRQVWPFVRVDVSVLSVG